ncbi:MAG: 30S ribosomal protein S11 [Candidatus Yanofskybacteria bacterium CG10_big_fil_rev_8_21_14_0_10_46_23]|uniref:Small ribosomal subunit protein uS11 n=1 Tax=Candidatus Yanofskybacteria bacterium CG10_big_fil_rev_8_21_14_0_10_46_23 TaxID=1975098 RepID=A0A2H0R4N5_9BACT|nr:MAG: 30S ribosomal protein S11 [Candidatus Yanofskybacteria bacterium CG10_big_fil_rev_8_21_14_0_10_46_23]
MGKKRIVTKEGGSVSKQNVRVSKKARKRKVTRGIVHVSSSFNNTIVSIADPNGEVFAWSSSGNLGFRGARKSTPYAATLVAQNAAEKAKVSGLMEVAVRVRGVGPGREAAIRGLISAGLEVTEISDETPLPHNGARPRKARRV